MFVVAAYDTPSDERRARLAHVLKDYGRRVQYSVFECHLTGKQLEELLARACRLLDGNEDDFRVYQLCEGCLKRVITFGPEGPYEAPDVLIV